MFISNLSNQESKTLLLISFFLVNIIYVNSVDTDLTVEIAPGSQECFYQQITKTGETTLEVEYQVRKYFAKYLENRSHQNLFIWNVLS